MTQELLRLAHVLGATVLFGTGAGIAFFMLMAHRTRDAGIIAHVSGTVVVADMIFTATAVVLQPVTGYLLAKAVGWSLAEPWILSSLFLFALTGTFWLPVVWIQIAMRNLAREAVAKNMPLPERYYTLFRFWFALGWPAFTAVLAIFWLMTTRPALW